MTDKTVVEPKEVANNVIKFPQRNTDIDIPTTQEELTESVDRIKTMFFDMVSIELSSPVFNRASMHGFDVSNDSYIKDCILVVEAIKSLLLKTKSIHHKLQDYADEHIDYDEDEIVADVDYDDDE